MSRKYLLSVQRQSVTQDDSGQQVETWTEAHQWWGSIRPIVGREYFNASGERAEITHEVEGRYGITVAPRDRLVYGSRVFNVRAVMNIEERNRMLKLMVTEHVV